MTIPTDFSSYLHQRFDHDDPSSSGLGGKGTVHIIDDDTDSEGFVVKFCKRNSPHVLKYFDAASSNDLAVDALAVESHVLTVVAERTSILVPEVLAVDLSPSKLPPYFVMEKSTGDSLHGQFHDLALDKQKRLMAEIGTTLTVVHESFPFSTCGPLRVVDDTLKPVDEYQWTEWCDTQWTTCLERLRETRFADLVPELKSWYATHRQYLPETSQAVLVHDDFRPANLLVDDAMESVTAIIDWEDVLAAPPEYQLARLEFLFIDVYEFPTETQSQLRTALYDSYGRFQLTDAYQKRRKLYQLLSILWKTGNFRATHQDTDEELRTSLVQQRRHRIQQMMSTSS
ncbi:phosphotransferase family protein [Halocatena salina]|uniref:Phosphotransferase n=1 Tax=Halocatena salina TaxID=2934340 RepID=A0A8U0A6Q6_9EURY|nr:phosphotransferase [Halocatena salina]UPM44861.1 phosphotransferase [Halocatena salina]